ncbi:MAG: SRPBCC domain-containing protein [Kofleriaceae bacterium]
MDHEGRVESWWGPRGFRVEVHTIDPRVGGALHYDMIASEPDTIVFMEQAGMPLSHATRGSFTEVVPNERLRLTHMIDVVPGAPPYENSMTVVFSRSAGQARMVIAVEPHRDPEWTKRSAMGMESQLTKVADALVARR